MKPWLLLLFYCLPAHADRCQWLVSTMAKQYQTFFSQAGASSDGDFARLFALKRAHCNDPFNAERIERFGARLFDRHSGRLGIVLPLTGPQASIGAEIREGMLTWWKTHGDGKPAPLLFEDSQSQYRETLKRMAELRVRHNVALWIVGGNTGTLQRVREWADALRMPTLLLGNQKIPTARSRYALRVFPRQADLARALAEETAKREWKRVGVLIRSEGKGRDFVSAFAAAAKPLGVEIHQVADYLSGNFASMNAAVKHLFQVDPELRSEEYERLEAEARSRAEARGVPFDPRTVILPGRRELDAILIPDNFRIVRHFLKLFRYHKVYGVPLLGTPQWRSRGLVTPPDPGLNGSLMVDFVSPYDRLPAGILSEAGEFLAPDIAQAVDARMMGYRALALALGALTDARRDIPAKLKSMDPPADPFFGTAPPFALDGSTHWPSFVFQVRGSELRLSTIHGQYQGRRFLSSDPSPSTLPPSEPPPEPRNR